MPRLRLRMKKAAMATVLEVYGVGQETVRTNVCKQNNQGFMVLMALSITVLFFNLTWFYLSLDIHSTILHCFRYTKGRYDYNILHFRAVLW